MKKFLYSSVLFLFLFAINIFPAYASTDQEIVDSFESFIQREMNLVYQTYKEEYFLVSHSTNKKNITWHKATEALDTNYIIDVTKSNSLISPYIGTLKISRSWLTSSDYGSREEAEKSAADRVMDINEYLFSFAYQKGKWVLTQYEARSRLLGYVGKFKPDRSFFKLIGNTYYFIPKATKVYQAK